MKKSLKSLGLSLCTLMLLAGCSCSNENDESVKANINNGTSNIVSGLVEGTKNIDLQKLYDDLKAEFGNETAAEKLLEIIAEEELLNDNVWKARYDAKMQEKLMKLVESGKYNNSNGEFDEKLLVSSLRTQLYTINCGENPVYGPTYVPAEQGDLENVIVDEYLKCDYSDYQERALKLEVLKELFNEKYVYDKVLKDKTTLFKTKKVREIEYVSISSGKDFSFEFITEAVSLLQEGKSLSEVADLWENKLKEELVTEFNKIGTKDDSTGTILQDFTNGYKRDKEEGLRLKMQDIYEEEYYSKTVITTDSKDVLNATLVDRIMSENVLDLDYQKTFMINNSYYLVSPLAGSSVDADDIRITDKANSKYYIVKVDVVGYDAEDENVLENERVYEAVKVLAKNTSLVSESVNYYLDKNKNNISVHDEEIYAYLKTQYADIFVD